MALMPPSALPLRRRLALAWLLLALVLAPTLGRMHQVLHLPAGLSQAQAQAHSHAHGPAGGAVAHGAHDGHHALGALHALFAGHSPVDCQTLDQQTLVGMVLGQLPALLPRPPQALPASAAAQAPGMRRVVPFHARAPPVNT